jgi:hypothetical protein
MSGAELQLAVSLSLFLGAILGALLCTYVRAGRNRLVTEENAFQACLELREQLESLQESLQADAPGAPPPAGKGALAGVGARPQPASPAWGAELDEAADEPVPSTKHPPNLAAWRRLERPPAPAISAARQARPAEVEIVAPIRRRPRSAERPVAINEQMAQEIVLRHFGVVVTPMPRPGASGAVQSDKILLMPPAHAAANEAGDRHSLAR